MKKISLIIIDDNQLLRDGIAEIIKQQPDLQLVAEFSKSRAAQTKVYGLKPDVLLLNHYCPDKNSLRFMKSLMKKCPEIKVIVTDVVPIQKDILQYVEAGVSGFIPTLGSSR